VDASTATSVFNSTAIDSSGNVYAVGYVSTKGDFSFGNGVTVTGSSDSNNAVIVKYDSSGKALWARTPTSGDGSSIFYDVAVASNGRIYVVGNIGDTSTYTFGTSVAATVPYSNTYAPVIVAYNASGTALSCSTTSTGSAYGIFFSLALTDADTLYAVGKIYGSTTDYTFGNSYGTATAIGSYDSSYSAVVVKYSMTDGRAIWANSTSSGDDESDFFSACVDDDGYVYCGGEINGEEEFDFGGSATATGLVSGSTPVLVKYGSGGSAIWAATPISSGTTSSAFSSVAVDSSGYLYALTGISYGSTTEFATGVSASGGAGGSFCVVKYDDAGTAILAKAPAATNSIGGSDLALDSEGNIYVTGTLTGGGACTLDGSITLPACSASSNAFLAKLGPTGSVAWAAAPSVGPNNSHFDNLAIGASGTVYAVGNMYGTSAYQFADGVTVAGSYSWANALIVQYKR